MPSPITRSPEILALVESGEQQLCFKGAPEDEAVLCTKVGGCTS